MVREFRKIWENTALLSEGRNVKYKCYNKHLHNAYLHHANTHIHLRITFDSMGVRFGYSTSWWDSGGMVSQEKRYRKYLVPMRKGIPYGTTRRNPAKWEILRFPWATWRWGYISKINKVVGLAKEHICIYAQPMFTDNNVVKQGEGSTGGDKRGVNWGHL